jgi:hypothetical protein
MASPRTNSVKRWTGTYRQSIAREARDTAGEDALAPDRPLWLYSRLHLWQRPSRPGRAKANRGDGSAIAWSHTKVLTKPRIRRPTSPGFYSWPRPRSRRWSSPESPRTPRPSIARKFGELRSHLRRRWVAIFPSFQGGTCRNHATVQTRRGSPSRRIPSTGAEGLRQFVLGFWRLGHSVIDRWPCSFLPALARGMGIASSWGLMTGRDQRLISGGELTR